MAEFSYFGSKATINKAQLSVMLLSKPTNSQVC